MYSTIGQKSKDFIWIVYFWIIIRKTIVPLKFDPKHLIFFLHIIIYEEVKFHRKVMLRMLQTQWL